jgi:hypothetical protein
MSSKILRCSFYILPWDTVQSVSRNCYFLFLLLSFPFQIFPLIYMCISHLKANSILYIILTFEEKLFYCKRSWHRTGTLVLNQHYLYMEKLELYYYSEEQRVTLDGINTLKALEKRCLLGWKALCFDLRDGSLTCVIVYYRPQWKWRLF